MHDLTRLVKLVYQIVTSCSNLEEKLDKIINYQTQQVPQTPILVEDDRWLKASDAGRIINQDRKTIIAYAAKGLIERKEIKPNVWLYKIADVKKLDKRTEEEKKKGKGK